MEKKSGEENRRKREEEGTQLCFLDHPPAWIPRAVPHASCHSPPPLFAPPFLLPHDDGANNF
jgi:hypothetical protein